MTGSFKYERDDCDVIIHVTVTAFPMHLGPRSLRDLADLQEFLASKFGPKSQWNIPIEETCKCDCDVCRRKKS